MPRSAPASLGFAWLINRLIYCCYRYGYEEFEIFICTVLLYHVIWPDDYLTYDAHMIPTCYHLTPDTGTWHVITWHLIPDTWYMTLNNWHAITQLTCYHLVLVHSTWYCDTWLDTITPDTCIILHIHDYYFYGTWHDYYIVTRHLVLLNSCALELLYTWTPEKGRLLILYSSWPSNWITMKIGLMWIPCGHYHWTICNN